MNKELQHEQETVLRGIDSLLRWYGAPRKPYEEPNDRVEWHEYQEFSPLNRLLLNYVAYVMFAVSHDDPDVDSVPTIQVMTTLETVTELIKEGRSDEVWPLLKANGIKWQ